MVTLSSVFILMSVLSGALAIPFLNNPQLTTVDNYDEGLSPVMADKITPEEAGKYPGKVSTSLGPDEFKFETLRCAFGERISDPNPGWRNSSYHSGRCGYQ